MLRRAVYSVEGHAIGPQKGFGLELLLIWGLESRLRGLGFRGFLGGLGFRGFRGLLPVQLTARSLMRLAWLAVTKGACGGSIGEQRDPLTPSELTNLTLDFGFRVEGLGLGFRV